jgi:hypothetical protein
MLRFAHRCEIARVNRKTSNSGGVQSTGLSHGTQAKRAGPIFTQNTPYITIRKGAKWIYLMDKVRKRVYLYAES